MRRLAVVALPIALLAASAALWGAGRQSARDEELALDDEIARHFGAPFRFLPIHGADHWAFAPDGGSLVAASAEGELLLHDLREGRDPVALATPGPVAALAVGRSFVAVAVRESGALLLFDRAGGESRELEAGVGRVTALAFAYGGAVLAAGGEGGGGEAGEEGWVTLLDPVTGEVEDRFAAGSGRVLDIAASGKLLAALPSRGHTRIFLDETRLETLEVATPEGAASIDLAAGPDRLAVAAPDRVSIHALSDPVRRALVLSGFAFERVPVRFRPGSQELATAGPDGRLVLWRLDGDGHP